MNNVSYAWKTKWKQSTPVGWLKWKSKKVADYELRHLKKVGSYKSRNAVRINKQDEDANLNYKAYNINYFSYKPPPDKYSRVLESLSWYK